MRAISAVLGVVLWAAAPPSSEACGDKFLRVGRGARFQRGYVALHPARIALFSRPDTAAGRAIRELEPALRRAGHHTQLVPDAAGLDAALRAAPFDLVMVEMADVRAIDSRLAGLPSRPAVLPVLHEPTPAALQAAEKEFACVIPSPGKKGDVLAEIDGVMEHRAKDGRSPAPVRK